MRISDNEDLEDDTSADHYMDEITKHEEGEDLSPDFVKTVTHLKWECLTHGASLAALECPFPKPIIYIRS
jgi:hypothetical protein